MTIFAIALTVFLALLVNRTVSALIFLVLWLSFSFYRFGKKFGLFLTIIAISGLLVAVILYFWIRVRPPAKVFGIVTYYGDNYLILLTVHGRMYVPIDLHQCDYGDVISVTGYSEKLNFVALESQFDFQDYLYDKGIFYSYTPTNTRIIWQSWWRVSRIKQQFLSPYTSNVQYLWRSLLFNEVDRSYTLATQTRALGLYVLFSTSGIYVQTLIRFMRKQFERILIEKAAHLLSLVILIPLFLIAPTKIAYYRISLLAMMQFVNIYKFKRKFNHLTLVSITALILMVINPWLVHQIGFYLGFGLSVLLYFARPALNNVPKLLQKPLIGVIIFLILIPYQAEQTGQIALLSPLFLLLLLPIMSGVVAFGVINLLVIALPGVSSLVNRGLEVIVGIVSKYSLMVTIGEMSEVVSIIFISALLLLLLAFELRFHKLKQVCLSIIALSISIQLAAIPNKLTTTVHFINVGQGDATLICHRDYNVLIDTGGLRYMDVGRDLLALYFRKQRISQINAVIITHEDYDHMGGLTSLQANFPVLSIVDRPEQLPLKNKDLIIENLNTMVNTNDDDNAKSLVLNFHLLNRSFLIMGDAPSEIERAIVEQHPNLRADIIKIGHHGSNTSTSAEFLQTVQPREAIVSVGRNYYGHPHREVLDRLTAHNVKIRRTDQNGTIVYREQIYFWYN